MVVETYLSDIRHHNKSLGVHFEVDLGSPQALVSSEGCLWMAENERRLEGERDGLELRCLLPIRSFTSDSTLQSCKILP